MGAGGDGIMRGNCVEIVYKTWGEIIDITLDRSKGAKSVHLFLNETFQIAHYRRVACPSHSLTY